MDTMRAISTRHSCRHYDPNKPLDDDLVEQILLAGSLAPSAKNRQPWRFVVVKNAQTRAAIADAMKSSCASLLGRGLDPKIERSQKKSLDASAKVVADAPVVVLVYYLQDSSWSVDSEDYWSCKMKDLEAVDMLGIGACMENMAIAATAAGVANLWMCDVLYAAESIAKILGTNLPLVAAMALGHEGGEPDGRKLEWSKSTRYSLNDLLRIM